MNNQPISITIENAKQAIVDTINAQQIQPCIMKYILKDVYEIVCKAAERETAIDETRWKTLQGSKQEE